MLSTSMTVQGLLNNSNTVNFILNGIMKIQDLGV